MKRFKNKKGFTLVELLAVIVVLAIVMGLAVVAITNVLENTRKSAFVADAKSYLDGAHSLVRTDEMNALLGSGASYAPSCDGTSTKPIFIKDIKLDQGGTSPYGSPYSETSFVQVKSEKDGTSCSYSYSIYLTDGTFSIGTPDAPEPEKGLSIAKLK